MTNKAKAACVIYALYVAVMIFLAYYGQHVANRGEYGLYAHFWMTVIGLPSSLISWPLSANGSVRGVLLATLLGVIQWVIVVRLLKRRQSNNLSKNSY